MSDTLSNEVCPQHGTPFNWVKPGISKRTGKPYQGFWSCPTVGCKEKPQQATVAQPTYQPAPQPTGWPAVRQQVAQKIAPEKAVMTRADWEAKEKRTNKNILLQVAFKAAVELAGATALQVSWTKQDIYNSTLEFHNWLLSQAEGQSKPSVSNLSSSEVVDPDFPPIEAYENDPLA